MDVDLHACLDSRHADVLQLLHSFLPHVLEFADVVVHVWDLHFAGRSRPPSSDLRYGFIMHHFSILGCIQEGGEGIFMVASLQSAAWLQKGISHVDISA